MPLMLGDLSRLIKGEDVPDKDALSDIVLRQMLLALECIASRDIIHRNIKPENILWEYDDAGGYRFRLGGFSLSATSDRATSAVGTEPFMAPEVFHRHQQTTKVDIWSLFAVIVWTRSVEFRRTCDRLSGIQCQAWLEEFSKFAQYAKIRTMATMNPRARPSATQQLAILDGLDDSGTIADHVPPSKDNLGDDLADTIAYYEVGFLSPPTPICVG